MEQLSALSETSFADSHAVLLDLEGVTFTDRAGTMTLRGLERQGAMLVGCSGFLNALLHEERATPVTPERGPEAALLTRLRAGDDAAFETLVRQYGARLLATARRMVRNDDEAQDVVQEAFLSAFASIATFSGDSKLSTWLHRIVVNAALMKLRRRRRKPEESIDELLPHFTDQGYWSDSPSSWDAPSDVLLQRRETREQVRRCIERLPETYRTVLMLRDIEDLDTDEVADLLGVSANAVKVRLHRARQALRTLLERELGATEASVQVVTHR